LTWSHFGTDGGELITAAVTLGIPHPSGYPTYIWLGKLFSLLPIGPAAFRFNLFSAAAVAGAAGLATMTSHQLFPQTERPNWAALAAGLTLAFSALVWSQAVIAEVYGLNLLFLAAFLWALLGKRPSHHTGLLLGISMTTHLTSMLMLPLAFGLSPRKQWFKLIAGIAVGLTPFLLLPWQAQTGSPVIWGQPTTLSGWWWLVSGRIYQPNLFSTARIDLISRSINWAGLLTRQFTWAGIPLILFAFFKPNQGDWRLKLGLLGTAVLYILYALNYNTNDAVVLLLPAILLLSFLLMPGLQSLKHWAILLPAALLLLNYNVVSLRGDHTIRPITLALLREAPENAILLTPGDQTIFTLWYFQHVELYRDDLILIDANLTAFDWYRERLSQRYPDIRGLERDDLTGLQQLNQGQRPFCRAALGPEEQYTLDCH
jgi:hypothetical protein